MPYTKPGMYYYEEPKKLTYLLVRFDSDAPMAEKSQNFILREKSHSLRRSVSHFTNSASIQIQKFVEQITTISLTQHSSHCYRKYPWTKMLIKMLTRKFQNINLAVFTQDSG